MTWRWQGHPNGDNTRAVDAYGYIKIYAPEHPAQFAGFVSEHILIAEEALGHFLPRGAVVHHFNEKPGDNGRGNLVICQDQKYHALLHKRRREIHPFLGLEDDEQESASEPTGPPSEEDAWLEELRL